MTREQRWRLGVAAVVAALVCAAFVAPASAVGERLLPFVAFLLLILPAHEFGHALAGLLVGYRITNISLGVGPLLFAFRVGRTTIQFHALPLAGLTRALPARSQGAIRLRQWILSAGGLAANVVVYLVLRRVFGAELGDATKHPFASVAADANVLVAIMNAIPFHTAEGATSDGYKLLKIPFWPESEIEGIHAFAETQVILDLLDSGDADGALRAAEDLRRRVPHLARAAVPLGLVLERQRRHAEARVVFREGLAQATAPATAAILKNNIAFSSVMLGLAADMPEAGQLSAEAFAALPTMGAVVGTRGAVLVRQGRGAEAIPLLDKSLALAETDRNRSTNRAFLARALRTVGRVEDARRAAAEARRLDPSNPLLDWAEGDAPLVEGAPPSDASVEAAGGVAPVGSEARPADVSSAGAEARALALVSWRRMARIFAFAAMLVLPQRLGVPISAYVIVAIVMSVIPEPSNVLALGLACAWAGLVQTSGQLHFQLEPWMPAPTGSAAIGFAFAVAAAGLLRWRRACGPQPPTRGARVLGIILAVVTVPSLVVTMIAARSIDSAIEAHESFEAVAEMGPMLVALGVLFASAPRRWLRVAAVVPFALVLVGLVGGSDWWLEHRALAGVPATGSPIAWRDSQPAKVLRTRKLATEASDAVISPGGLAFALKLPLTDSFQIGDFGDRLVEIPARTVAFVDDGTIVADCRVAKGRQLCGRRPFASDAPLWTKAAPSGTFGLSDLAYDGESRSVYLVAWGEDDGPLTYRTSPDADAPFVLVPSRSPHQPKGDDDDDFAPVGRAFTTTAVSELWPEQIPRALGRLRCATAVGTDAIWCMPNGHGMSSILVRADGGRGVVERIPGGLGLVRSLAMLDRTHLVLVRWDELRIIDLEERRGERLTLTDDQGGWSTQAAVGGALALFKRGDARKGDGATATITVYARPGAPRASAERDAEPR
jgi:Flp pilus assembly protein TadD